MLNYDCQTIHTGINQVPCGLIAGRTAAICTGWYSRLLASVAIYWYSVIPMLIVGIWTIFSSPELLRKRLSAKEEQNEQKWVVALSGLLFIAMFVVAGLNFRFGWLLMPNWTTYVAAGIFLLGYILYAEVMHENVWLSRTVEVQENQQVIDTGLYGIVRHPMYSATLILFLSMPLVLNSIWSFVLMLLYIPIIVKRIRNEEVVLERDLAGYKEYKQRVRYKVIPFIW